DRFQPRRIGEKRTIAERPRAELLAPAKARHHFARRQQLRHTPLDILFVLASYSAAEPETVYRPLHLFIAVGLAEVELAQRLDPLMTFALGRKQVAGAEDIRFIAARRKDEETVDFR